MGGLISYFQEPEPPRGQFHFLTLWHNINRDVLSMIIVRCEWLRPSERYCLLKCFGKEKYVPALTLLLSQRRVYWFEQVYLATQTDWGDMRLVIKHCKDESRWYCGWARMFTGDVPGSVVFRDIKGTKITLASEYGTCNVYCWIEPGGRETTTELKVCSVKMRNIQREVRRLGEASLWYALKGNPFGGVDTLDVVLSVHFVTVFDNDEKALSIHNLIPVPNPLNL